MLRRAGGIHLLTFDNDRLTINSDLSLPWPDVKGAVAFKRDCLFLDQICLAFSTNEGAVEINEEMEGWDALLSALPSLLAGFPPLEEW